MAARKRHPSKEIESAIKYAEQNAWCYIKAGTSAHAWGRLRCPQQNREGCSLSIWSTPRNTIRHAKQIRSRVDQCPHKVRKKL